MRISDWSSDVCSSDLLLVVQARHFRLQRHAADRAGAGADLAHFRMHRAGVGGAGQRRVGFGIGWRKIFVGAGERSEEHTSELQSLMRISYAVFCLKKKKNTHNNHTSNKYTCLILITV